jgi:hypothetical protein
MKDCGLLIMGFVAGGGALEAVALGGGGGTAP